MVTSNSGQHRPPSFSNDVDEGVFLFEALGYAVFCGKYWSPGNRSDLIFLNPTKHAEKFQSFKINSVIEDALQPTQENVLNPCWNCFVKIGIK